MGAVMVLSMVLMMLMAAGNLGAAPAVSVEDIVLEVAGRNSRINADHDASAGTEPVSGGSFKFYHIFGDLGAGYAYFSISEPVGGTSMQAVIDFMTGQLDDDAIMNVVPMNGYELREVTYADYSWGLPNDEVEVWLVLPQYVIQVELYETGYDKATNLQKEKEFALQLMDGLKKAGLLSPAAPVGVPAGSAPTTQAGAPAAAVTGTALDEPVKVSDTMNIAGVYNGPTVPTTFSVSSPHLVTFITTYHWNNARGATPGTIALKDNNGKVYGPWAVTSRPGQGGVPNAYWEVTPNIVVPAGTYTVVDSDPATWSRNSQSGGKGMGEVRATPHFEVASGSVNGLKKDAPGSRTSVAGGLTESPAGVGSAGNIPGPSNAAEAVVGVAVPGLIATILGAMGGLGGGGGCLAPSAGGIPLSTAGAGPLPGAGGTPGTGTGRTGLAQAANHLGRRRPEENYVPGTAENGLIVETADEAGVIKPDSGIIIETADEAGVFVQPESGLIIESPEEAAVIKPGAGTLIDDSDGGILIDTSALEDKAPARAGATLEGGEAGAEAAPVSEAEATGISEESAYDQDGYNSEGFDKDGFDRNGFDKEGFNREGYDKAGFDKEGFNKEGFNREGFNKEGFDKEGFNKEGFDQEGFNKEGFNKEGFDRDGFNKAGFDKDGFDKEGFNKDGYDKDGFNRKGFDKQGFDREGFNEAGFDKQGFDKEGFNKEGFDREGFNKEGFNKEGFDKEGFNKEGFNKEGFDRDGFNKAGFDKQGFDKEGFNKEGFNKEGFDREGFNKEGFDREGFNKKGFNKKGFDREGFDQEGFNKDGLDREGYGKNGFDRDGYNREGYDVNGYDRKGYNRSGYDAKGYDRQGYDKAGFNKEGWDRDGYDRNGFNKESFDREGYDQAGYDKDGYNRDGYNREGMEREGYDENGFDKDGFNKNGVDKDGFDREGFDYEGYNREGYDPWGYDKQGYGKDGYHWSGYNADGYNRDGRHWSENPFEGDGNPFNVAKQDPFGEKEVIPFGAEWKPTKPKLGEPYPRTVEKYGAKPWTDEIPQPEPEKPTIPTKADTGVIGPEDPMNTLEKHNLGVETKVAPEGQSGTGLPIPEEDIPGAGDMPQDTIPEPADSIPADTPTADGLPRPGERRILVGKADGQTYEIEYNGETGEWINTESGNSFDPDKFESWQNDLAEDKRRIAIDIEKMAARQDANSKAIDDNLATWKNLEQMQKAVDNHNIGEPGGPGDIDKAIQNLKDDMLAGKEVDQDRLEQLKKIIGNRITGKTAVDTVLRKEEDWIDTLGYALEANAATAKEVVTGEKADGSISWLGMGARIMITAATGGGASLTTLAGEITRQGAMDGILTVAEAMYRIKDSIDKGESDFRAVSKAIGLVILSEEIGWLAGKAGGKLMGEMLERFPAFTNKAADLIEKGVLFGAGLNQIGSRGLGMVTRQSAEEALDQINKQLVDLGGDSVQKALNKAGKYVGLGAAGAGDQVAQRVGKAASSIGDDIAKGTGRAASGSSDDIAKGARKAASSSDDMAKGTGKAASGSGDDMAKGAGSSADSPKASDSPDTPQKTAAAGGDGPGEPNGADGPSRTGDSGGDGPGEPGRPSSGSDAGSTQDDIISNRPLNTNARTPEEVLADPAAVARAENTVHNNTRDFDKLPPAQQQELIREQSIYDEYKMQAQERNYNLADKVQRGERISVEDVMEMKADPASMRTLKNLEHTEGIGAELGELRSRQVQSEFNEVLETQIHQPSYREVESHLSARYNGAEIRCNTVRTPGTELNTSSINTDNDVIAERLVNGPNGPEWVEIPKSEWEDVYHEAFARNSGFNVDDAARRFPEKNWANMDDATRYREWANLHEETPMDQFDPMAARDFSGQRTAILNGERPDGPLLDRDGNLLRDPLDAEQLGMMEKHKANDYWNKGDTPAEIMKNQTESLEQLRKTAQAARNLEGGTHNMPSNMQEAIRVVNDNNLSPALRAARLRELGYDTPGDLTEKLTSRIGSFRAGNR